MCSRATEEEKGASWGPGSSELARGLSAQTWPILPDHRIEENAWPNVMLAGTRTSRQGLPLAYWEAVVGTDWASGRVGRG